LTSSNTDSQTSIDKFKSFRWTTWSVSQAGPRRFLGRGMVCRRIQSNTAPRWWPTCGSENLCV